MKRVLPYIAILFLLSCGSRKAEIEKSKIAFMDKTEIRIKGPGAIVSVPLPKKERPRAQQKVYTGEHNAKAIITFDSIGIVTNVLCICPEVDILKKNNIKLKEQIKSKETERKGIEFGQVLLWMAGSLFIGIIIGWYLRGRLKTPLLSQIGIFTSRNRKK